MPAHSTVVRRLLPALLLAALGCQTPAVPAAAPFQCGIVEEAGMARVLRESGPGTVVVFDIDNTLLEPRGHSGSDQWYDFLVETHVKCGMSATRAIEEADRAFNAWQDRIEVQCVDPNSPQVLATLRENRIPFFALTARSAGAAALTHRQLEQAGLHLQDGRFTPRRAADAAQLGHGAAYHQGVFFIGELGLTKGQALAKILDLSGHAPKRIVFVDDKAKHTRTVQEAMRQRGIPCLCLRFSRADGHVRAFRQDVEHADALLGNPTQ